MIDRLHLNENAYFFARTNPARFTSQTIDSIFEEALEDKSNASEVFRTINQTNGEFLYSMLIFTFEDVPNFLLDAPDNSDFELRYGYLIVVEIGDFIVISKKNASGLKTLRDGTSNIDYNIISRLYVDDSSLFEKFFMRNMDISDSAIRQRQMEALNLKNSVPLLTSTKYILSSMRVKNFDQRMSIAFNTSRIQRVGVKRGFFDLLEWIHTVVEKLNNYGPTESYLDYFPVPIDFEERIEDITPISILFFTLDLINELESEQLTKIEYHKPNGDRLEVDPCDFMEFLDSISKYRDLIRKAGVSRQYSTHCKEIGRLKLSDKGILVKINRKSITVKSTKLSRVVLTRNGKEINLEDYLNRHNEFVVNFNPPDILYHNSKLFHDSNLIAFTTQFMRVFIPHSDWDEVTSEKGLPEEYSERMTEFPLNSLFRKVVDDNPSAICTICDDQSTEWADFIVVNEDEMKLVHAKHKTSALSASQFHDVVAQAQKNIGQFSASAVEWKRREGKWTQPYRLHSVQTCIKRISGMDDFNEVVKRIQELSIMPNLQKTLELYVTFLSKNELEEEFQRIRNVKTSGKPQVIQLLWLISSLISSCIENNIRLFIHCKE